MSPEIGAVGKRFVVYLEYDIVNCIYALDVGAVWDVVGDVHDAGVVVADSDFCLAAAHSIAHESSERTGSDFDFSDFCANLCERGFHAHSYVRRAAYNVGKLRLARVNL